MKNLKKFGFAVFVVGLLTYASTASASTFTSPSGTTYTSSITGTSTNMALSGAFVTVTCKHSVFTAQVQKHGSVTDAGGAINKLEFTGCNYPVSVKNNGSMDVDSSASLDLFNTEISVETSVGSCVFTADSALFGGTAIGTFTKGSPAVFDFSGEIDRTAGSFLCGSHGHWLGNYTVTTPGSLFID